MSTHTGEDVMNMAEKAWNSAGVCGFPFYQGYGLERDIEPLEIKVLQTLFANEVEQYYPEPDDEEYEDFVKNGNKFSDKEFLHLSFGTRWDFEGVIDMIFKLAKFIDPNVSYKRFHASEVNLF
jgi:hypothetical protein